MNPQTIYRYALLIGLGISMYLLLQAWNQDYGQKNGSSQDPDAPPMEFPGEVPGEGQDPVSDGNTSVTPTVQESTNSDGDFVPGSSLVRQGSSESALRLDDSALVKVTTPSMHVWIDRNGGDVVRVRLPEHPVSLDDPDEPLTILDRSLSHVYVAQSGLVGRDGPDAGGARPKYSAPRDEYQLDSGDLTVKLTHQADTYRVEKWFLFNAESNLINVEHHVVNQSNDPFVANLYAQLTRDGLPVSETSGFFGPRPYLGGALTTPDDRYKKVSFEDLDEQRFSQENNGGWIAILQHYFLSAWAASDDASYLYYGLRDSKGYYRYGFTGPEIAVPAGETGIYPLKLYVGPKDQGDLEEISEHLNLTVDYGWLWWLSMPLFYLLELCQSLVVNWGLAIILLTIVVKAVLYPLSAMSYKSMAKMRVVAPQMKRIQERFGTDRQRLSQEMMSLYKKEGVNPLLGCLPMLAQLPVFIALYWVLYESVELRQAPFVFWIQDLSAMDPFFVLPLLMGATMFLMQMLNPPMPDPMQQKIMKFMPIAFTILFVFFPSGLVLYWLINNVLSFAQQYFTTKSIEKASAAKKSS
ncbi:MAG: membrane protein insertase YidC [Gammaproteobacteria bacterium]|nr:membrane protein insertase YidC [Gammaproteobacteria bacterium]